MSDRDQEVMESAVEEESVKISAQRKENISEPSNVSYSSGDISNEPQKEQEMHFPTMSQFALRDNFEAMRRNDSFGKFGHMETISLDATEQDPQSVVNYQSEFLENKKLNEDSRELEKSNLNVENNSGPEPVLSKYFSLPVDAIQGNSIEFFDALSTVSSRPTYATVLKQEFPLASNPLPASFDVELSEKTSSRTINIPQEVNEIDGSLEPKMKPNTQNKIKDEPVLFKLFANDSSGGNKTAAQFFDEIANEKDSTFQTIPIDSSNHILEEPLLHSSSLKFDPDVTSLLSPDTSLISSVKANSDDQMYDAWIPTEKTKQILMNMVTSTLGTYFPDKDDLTMPGVIIEEDMADPVTILLHEARSPMAEERKAPTMKDVTEDEDGLKKLIAAHSYHAAINLTTRLLTAAHQGPGQGGHPSRHTPFTMQLWFTRLALFVKLKKFPLAEVESDAFGNLDKPDLYYEFYPDTYIGRKGTMVPFSFRILLAELPQYQGNHQIALDNLYSLLAVIQKITRNLNNGYAEDGSMIEMTHTRCKASLELWEKRECRVLYSILNCILSQRDYVMAVSVANILIQKDKEHVRQLHSAMGRIFLQLGDVNGAQNSFSKASSLKENSEDKNMEVENLINNALLSIAHNEPAEAYRFYQKAYSHEPANAMLANNMAVCLLYMGRLKESLSLLEQTVQNKPNECLHDGILFNTCTLYELESSHSTLKKYAMLNLISIHAGDDFNVSCLKIPPVPRT